MGKKIFIVTLPNAGGRLVSYNVLASSVANAIAIAQTTLNVNHDPTQVNVLLTGMGSEVIDIESPVGGRLAFFISIKDANFSLAGQNILSDSMSNAINSIQTAVGTSNDPAQVSNLLNGRGTGQIDLATN